MENTRSFSINLVGDSTQEKYTGTFKVKCLLGPLERFRADEIRRELLGSNAKEASSLVHDMAIIFSELSLRIIDGPIWWFSNPQGTYPGIHIKDQNVWESVFSEAVKMESQYKQEIREKADKAKEELTKDASPSA